MNIVTEIEPFDKKQLKDLKPGECFVAIDPQLLESNTGVYMQTNEGTSIDLTDGRVYHSMLSPLLTLWLFFRFTSIKNDLK